MPTWIKCTTTDGVEITVNGDQVALIRPHNRDRGGRGSEIMFATGTPSSVAVKEDQQQLTGMSEN
jgi:hypothetical protein